MVLQFFLRCHGNLAITYDVIVAHAVINAVATVIFVDVAVVADLG